MLFFKSPIGNICIEEKENKIISLKFSKYTFENYNFTNISILCKEQIIEYFSGKRKFFNCSFELLGTDFEKEVWNEVLKIPYGKTKTYKEIAQNTGNTKAVRAVANILRLNPLPIIVPCHRVIGSDGKLTGYKYGIDKKIFLLNIEKANI